MKLLTYAMGFFVLVGGFALCTEFGLTANMVGFESTGPQALGYPVSYMQNGQVMSAAYMDGKEVKGISFGIMDDDDLLLPQPKKAVAGVHYPSNNGNRTVVHSSTNVCTGNSCSPTVRYYSPTVRYYNPTGTVQYNNSCGTRYYGNAYNTGTQYYHTGSCGNTYRHWNYQRGQPLRNAVRLLHNRRPLRRAWGRAFCGR